MSSMQCGRLWILLVLLGFFGFGGASPIIAGSCPEVSQWLQTIPPQCMQSIAACALPFERYASMNETDIIETIRNTPLYRQCKDSTKLGRCLRRKAKGPACSGVPDCISAVFLKFLGIYEFSTNYICKQHFKIINRNFQCIVSQELQIAIQSGCNISYTNFTNFCDDPQTDVICDVAKKASNCASLIVKAKCGANVAKVIRELDVQVTDQLLEAMLGKTCFAPTSSKIGDGFDFMKRFCSASRLQNVTTDQRRSGTSQLQSS